MPYEIESGPVAPQSQTERHELEFAARIVREPHPQPRYEIGSIATTPNTPTPPKPQTKRAVLRSEAYPDREVFTEHVFVETRRTRSGWAFIFKCLKTGRERIWGLEPK